VNVLANGGGDTAGCGAPGAPVRIVILDGEREVASWKTTWNNTDLHELPLIPAPTINLVWLPLVAR
jgi:hypothetical protein